MSRVSAAFSFPFLQVLSDLRSVAVKGFMPLAARMQEAQTPGLRRVVFEKKCRLSVEDAASLHDDLLLIAALPEKDFNGFVAATALLLADRLQDGAGDDDLYWNWDTFKERYRAAPAPVRAALMNGFRWAHATRKVDLEIPPAGRDLNTYNETELLEQLRGIVRSMTEAERDAVCALAQDNTEDIHRRVLDKCLASNCVLSDFGGWFPGDVVDRASLDCTHPGFAAAMALVLIDAIATRDEKGRMARRWEDQAADFNLLQPDVRKPLVAGVRHLHEMGFDWKPYARWPAAEIVEKAIVVPFVKA